MPIEAVAALQDCRQTHKCQSGSDLAVLSWQAACPPYSFAAAGAIEILKHGLLFCLG